MTLNKELRWVIMSFINEPSFTKIYYSKEVINQIKQYFLKKEVIYQLTPGCRKVCIDDDGLCLNCYHYGVFDPQGVCMNHWGSEPEIWMSYDYYSSFSALINKNETWEEFNVRTIEENRIKQEEENKYLSEIRESLDEFYRQDRIRMFFQAIDNPQDYQAGFIYMLLRKIKRDLHRELYQTVSIIN